MNTNQASRELTVEEVDFVIDPKTFGFETSDKLEPLEDIVGQDRALRALDLGLGIDHPTYNIYVSGLQGTGKKETIRRALDERVHEKKAVHDWVYVNNFDEPDRPFAMDLEPGQGFRLRKQMEQLVKQICEELPKAFRQEDFSREKKRLNHRYEKKHEKLYDELQEAAQEKGLLVQQIPNAQVVIVPAKDGRPMSEEELNELSDEERDALQQRQQELVEEAGSLLRKTRELNRQLSADVTNVEKSFAARLIEPMVDEISRKYDGDKLKEWFAKLKEHMVEHRDQFQEGSGAQAQTLTVLMGGGGAAEQGGVEPFTEYKVNLLVDNSRREAPVIIEECPNYKNLFGTIGGSADRMGRVISDFTKIRAGSLLRANGGYLVLDIMEALKEPLVWKELKRTIKSGLLEFHSYDPLGIFTSTAIRPEPIPLKVKLVVLGNPLVYHLLHLYDEDFPEIFKVKSDFANDMERDEHTGLLIGRFVQKIGRQESLPPFTAGAVAVLLQCGARIAGDRDKLTIEFSRMADLVRESSFWARRNHAEVVDAEHVRQAVDEKVCRSNLIAEKMRELIAQGLLLINVEGTEIGQVNGLSVINLGDYMFGRPSRVTASVGIGASGLINIERESKLSGRTFDKAMLIIDGYLRNRYAGKHPLALSASIAMEQSYGMIEGDSASVAELVTLLSALAQLPLRQDIAITGSINQWGEVQAIGGVTEKIEGFYDVCKQQGLTGEQGVCIPASNIRNMILRPDVVNAVKEGQFHIWAVDHIDGVLKLLSGMEAGSPEQADSFHGRVEQRLLVMAEALQKQRVLQVQHDHDVSEVEQGPKDPRPPLPGKETSNGL